MGQRDNFLGGFLAGAIAGGVVGGILGVLVTSKMSNDSDASDEAFSTLEGKGGKKRAFGPAAEQSIEVARRGLEDKIAQLNDAIDDVRQQLGSVNGVADDDGERAIAHDA